MARKVKYYIVRIDAWQKGNNQALWYAGKEGEEFTTQLTVAENVSGSMVPVFKCIQSPFYHVYPGHCTVVKEETIEI